MSRAFSRSTAHLLLEELQAITRQIKEDLEQNFEEEPDEQARNLILTALLAMKQTVEQ